MLKLIYATLEINKYSLDLVIDLREVFSTVDHNILHLKLEYYLKSYFNNRHQYVFIKDITS